jgi:endonuclease YncB( thermonuclease family)
MVYPASSSAPTDGAPDTDLEAVLGDGAAALDITGVVEQLSDGDTIAVRADGYRLRVRLLGIDAPELHFRGQSQNPWAETALQQLHALAPPGTRVRLITDRQRTDQYRRLLAYVIRGSLNLNLELLRRGWAVAYQIYPNVALFRPMQGATAAAQAGRRGIFDPHRPLPTLPYEFRQQVEQRPPAKFCGDSRTRRYYPPLEYRRVPVPWRVFFFTEADARAFGYSPALPPAAMVPGTPAGSYTYAQEPPALVGS